MRNYIGLIHKEADTHFGVSFPDFPGVVTAGTDLDDARNMADEALTLHVEGMAEDREFRPLPLWKRLWPNQITLAASLFLSQ
jgi:predicted RNase H-like HicB family nuclease